VGGGNEVSGEPLGTGGIGQANSRAITDFFLFSLLKRYGLPGAKSRYTRARPGAEKRKGPFNDGRAPFFISCFACFLTG